MSKGEVKERSEEGDTFRTKVLKVKICQAVRTQGSRALRNRDSAAHQLRRERRKRMIELQLLDFTQDLQVRRD